MTPGRNAFAFLQSKPDVVKAPPRLPDPPVATVFNGRIPFLTDESNNTQAPNQTGTHYMTGGSADRDELIVKILPVPQGPINRTDEEPSTVDTPIANAPKENELKDELTVALNGGSVDGKSAANSTNQDPTTCDTYGGGVELKSGFKVSYVQGMYNRVFTLGRMITPPLNQKQTIRFLIPPNNNNGTACSRGSCWACLSADVDKNNPENDFVYPTLEQCNVGLAEFASEHEPGKDAYALAYNRGYHLNGNYITWKFVPSGTGPDGVKLYNVMGAPSGADVRDALYIAKFLANVAVYEVERPADSRDNDLNEYARLESIVGKPVAFVNPCDGTILRHAFGYTGMVPLNDIPGIYFLKNPPPDNWRGTWGSRMDV